MNIGRLKKSIVRETLVFAAIIGVIGAGVYFISTLHDEYLRKKMGLESDTNSLISQKTLLQDNYTNLQSNMDIYQQMEQHATSPGLYIDGEAVKRLFSAYRSQFYMPKIAANMKPAAEMTGNPKLVRKNFVATSSEVEVLFEATTDEDVYELIRAFQEELPGFSKITEITIKRSGELSEIAIQAIQKEGAFKLVDGQIKFTWYGLKATDPNRPANKVVIRKSKRRREL